MYPALRSDRFDPLEKACDSEMLAVLLRDARAPSLWFYAGFLNRPTHCPARLNRMGAGGPTAMRRSHPPARPGRSTPDIGLHGDWERHRDGPLTASVGPTGSSAAGAFAAVAGSSQLYRLVQVIVRHRRPPSTRHN